MIKFIDYVIVSIRPSEEGLETVRILSWWPQNKHGVKLLGGNENG